MNHFKPYIRSYSSIFNSPVAFIRHDDSTVYITISAVMSLLRGWNKNGIFYTLELSNHSIEKYLRYLRKRKVKLCACDKKCYWCTLRCNSWCFSDSSKDSDSLQKIYLLFFFGYARLVKRKIFIHFQFN